MKTFKLIALILSLAMIIGLAACKAAPPADTKEPEPSASNTPEIASPGKIAVIRNMTSSDHTAQFFAGCAAEGEALGYKVDTFMSDGDDVKMQELMENALQQDYDIWILSHANEGYQNEMVSKAVAKGIFVSCFDCGGEHVPGVSYMSQNDEALASISMNTLIEKAVAAGADKPVKFIEVNILGAIVPFDNRHAAIEELIAAGDLERANLISPPLQGDFYTDVYNGISTTLAQDANKEIKGVWSATSAFLSAVIDAIKDADRDDVLVAAVDISDTEILRLIEEPAYVSCAAVDPYVIGVVAVRLAVLNSLGEETPEVVQFDAVAITRDKLQAGDTMATLSNYFEGFGATNLYETQEILDLKAETAAK
ncbi:MAG: substrate-binding domain-containing protein [Oscillospiraceae bacterium]|jgi:simple sugar transport system substrate-binding protein|nr:substrate-binding domain-containing protein [Oscillospiraceae bacterium]